MGKGGGCCCSIIFHVSSILQVCLAIAIICIVAIKLDNVTYSVEGFAPTIDTSCTLGADWNNTSLCAYVYAVCGISLVVSSIISIVQCCTCNLCGLGKILDLLFAGFGLVWWVIAAAVVQSNVTDASNDPLVSSLQDWRTATVACMWTQVGLFALLCISALFRVCGMIF